jgi:hypothetical protein
MRHSAHKRPKKENQTDIDKCNKCVIQRTINLLLVTENQRRIFQSLPVIPSALMFLCLVVEKDTSPTCGATTVTQHYCPPSRYLTGHVTLNAIYMQTNPCFLRSPL